MNYKVSEVVTFVHFVEKKSLFFDDALVILLLKNILVDLKGLNLLVLDD